MGCTESKEPKPSPPFLQSSLSMTKQYKQFCGQNKLNFDAAVLNWLERAGFDSEKANGGSVVGLESLQRRQLDALLYAMRTGGYMSLRGIQAALESKDLEDALSSFISAPGSAVSELVLYRLAPSTLSVLSDAIASRQDVNSVSLLDIQLDAPGSVELLRFISVLQHMPALKTLKFSLLLPSFASTDLDVEEIVRCRNSKLPSAAAAPRTLLTSLSSHFSRLGDGVDSCGIPHICVGTLLA